MPVNTSVERFKKLTAELQNEVHAAAVQELNTQANKLKDLIASVAPVYKGPSGGSLRHSVRVIPGKKDTVVRVVAGGELTTRNEVSSTPYDYARADEFGTVNMQPQPFFFPTYRLARKRMISTMKRRIAASIKKRSAE